jgi:hypothetical protein
MSLTGALLKASQATAHRQKAGKLVGGAEVCDPELQGADAQGNETAKPHRSNAEKTHSRDQSQAGGWVRKRIAESRDTPRDESEQVRKQESDRAPDEPGSENRDGSWAKYPQIRKGGHAAQV